jgi:hypothetical protein
VFSRRVEAHVGPQNEHLILLYLSISRCALRGPVSASIVFLIDVKLETSPLRKNIL